MKKFVVLYIFSALIFILHFSFSGQAIYGDGIDYWAYMPTLYFDHDLNFENQYKHFYSPANNNATNPITVSDIQKTKMTSIGKTDNLHPPGTAFIWFPVFILAHILSAIFVLPRNGYADIYQIAVGLWSLVLVILGLRLNDLIIYKIVKDRKISLLASIGIFFASPLLYYGSYDVLNSHFASFFIISLFWYVIIYKEINIKLAIVLGAIAGLATLVRIQDFFLLVIAFIYVIKVGKDFVYRKLLILTSAFIVTLIPLFIVWQELYGRPLSEVYTLGNHVFRGYLGSLFHKTNGLFSRTPILLFSFIGLKKFIKKDNFVFFLMFSYFLVQLIIITYWGGWEAAAYGGRMYVSSLPFFGIILAFTLKKINKKWNFKYAVFLVLLFSILNILSILSFVLFEKQVNSGRKSGLEEHTQLRIERLIEKYINN